MELTFAIWIIYIRGGFYVPWKHCLFELKEICVKTRDLCLKMWFCFNTHRGIFGRFIFFLSLHTVC